MTEAADAKPEPGWYVGYWRKEVFPVHFTGLLYEIPSAQYAEPFLPPGWTLGPAITGLLRDAARYRWLRDNLSEAWEVTWQASDGDELGALIDAEMARERKQ